MKNNGLLKQYKLISALFFGLVLPGCSTVQSHDPESKSCIVGNPMQESELFFGLSRPDGSTISESEWQAFVDQEVTPRFTAGLTVSQAQGQWLGNNGAVVKEGSRVLTLIYPMREEQSLRGVDEIRALYQSQFDQESVMRVDSHRCVSF